MKHVKSKKKCTQRRLKNELFVEASLLKNMTMLLRSFHRRMIASTFFNTFPENVCAVFSPIVPNFLRSQLPGTMQRRHRVRLNKRYTLSSAASCRVIFCETRTAFTCCAKRKGRDFFSAEPPLPKIFLFIAGERRGELLSSKRTQLR